MDFEKWLLIEVEKRKILNASQIQQAKTMKTQHFVETGESIPFSKFMVENRFITSEQLRNLIDDFSQKKRSNSLDKTLREKKYLGKIPEKFDHYHVVRKLGEGSFGEVYLAEDKRLKRKVAIKILSKQQKNSLNDFYQEVQTVAKLKHPHIIKVHDVGQVDGHPYFTMDYIDGSSLEDLIKQDEHINPVKIAHFTIKLAKALFFAHKQGIIHRDIKPANIMIDKNDEPYLMDFGLARALKVENNESGIIGTPHYMSPEQAKGQELTIQSDVYSLGATLYEMLCGHVPFPGKDFVETLRLITEEKPKPPSILYSRVPSELEKICLRALEKDLLLRYRTALAMARDIEEYIRNRTIKKDVQAAVTQQTNSFFWSHTKYLLVIFFLSTFSVLLWWSTWSKYSGENEKLYRDLVSVTEKFAALETEQESTSKKLYMLTQEKDRWKKKASMFDATVQRKLDVLQQQHEYLRRYAKLLRHKTISKNIQKVWPMAGGNLQRNGFCITAEMDSISHLLWKFDLKEELYNSPIVGENAVFLSGKEKLYAIDKNTGIEKWSVNIRPCISPVVTKEFVYVASDIRNAEQNTSMLYALHRETGQVQWSFTLEKVYCTVLVWKNTVYIGGKKIYALNANDGSLRWKSKPVDQIKSMVVANNKIVFSSDDKLYIFSYKGKNIAQHLIKSKYGVVAYDRNVFLTNSRQITIYDVDKQQPKKKLSLNSRIFASPAITKKVVYVPTREGIAALSLEGKTMWSANIGEVRIPPIVTPLLLYAASNDGYLYIIDTQTGKVCWKYASGSIYAPLVVLQEKMYYSAYGTFYCFTNK